MRITIMYESGLQMEGVVLSANAHGMRVAFRDHEDVSEFRFIEGRWRSELGAVVHVEALLVNPSKDWQLAFLQETLAVN